MFYLKYRPQIISELDNERIKASLGKALLNNEFSHAYLLIGTRGSGKTTTARLIAKIVNCESRKKGEEPCNKCDSCVAVMEGRSLDVIEIDAASNTGVDDIRELREKVKLAPVSSKYKVYIIDEVHMLSTSAFNALLKTLEEPPKHVIFVLATTDPQKLPQTIVSRCLVYDFGRAKTIEIVASLRKKSKKEGLDIADETLQMLAEKSDGSFRDADKLLEQFSRGEEVGDAHKTDEIAKKLLMKKDIKIIKEYVDAGGRVKDLILAMILILKDEMLEKPDNIKLIEKLLEANGLIKDSPIPELPLEMVIVELGQRTTDVTEPQTSQKVSIMSANSDMSEMSKLWPEFINAVKPFNHNLSALLRSSMPKELRGDFLTIEAFYKFHKDKLSEEKNRQVLEKTISGIMGREIRIKFTLKEV